MGTSYLQHLNFPSARSLTRQTEEQLPTPQEKPKTPPEEPVEIAAIPVDPCVTTEQAAEILGRSVEALRKLRQRGKGPAFIRYPDGVIRYRLSVLMKFLDECTVTP